MLSAALSCLALLLAPAAVEQQAFEMNTHRFAFPVKVDPNRRDEIERLVLMSSSDRGKTWQEIASASVDAKHFKVQVPADGEYWFNIKVVWKNGEATPGDFRDVPPAHRVIVQTNGKADLPAPAQPPQGEIEEIKAELKNLQQRVRDFEAKLKMTTRSRLQLAEAYRLLAVDVQNALANSDGDKSRLQRDYQHWMLQATEDYLELSRLLEKSELKGDLDTQERRKVPLLAGECLFNLGRYHEAEEVFDHQAKLHAGHPDSLQALGGSARCLAALAQGDKFRQRLDQIRGLLDKVEGPERKKWEEWVTVVSKPVVPER
jgi:hypothetical protein